VAGFEDGRPEPSPGQTIGAQAQRPKDVVAADDQQTMAA
jgi:hypothetical protein